MIFCPYSRSDTNYKICDFLTNFFECPRVYSTAESNIAKTKKTYGGNMSERHSSKINCPRSHYQGLYHIFISLNDEEVMGKSRPKHFPPTMFHHRLCPSLPCIPQADIPSAVRPPIAARLTKSRATSLFPQGPKNSQFSATGP